jgi:hypothetical protein
VRVLPALTPAHLYVAGPRGQLLEAYDELFIAEERLVEDCLEGWRRICGVARSR